MKKKLLLQDISDYIALQEGISKKDADTFVRAFFEVIEQGLLEENFVKIKGLGTFKLVMVSERESVNINTGERFQISSHTKVTFTPDNNMKELINRPFAHFETVDLSDDTSISELEKVDQEMIDSMAYEEEEDSDDYNTVDELPEVSVVIEDTPNEKAEDGTENEENNVETESQTVVGDTAEECPTQEKRNEEETPNSLSNIDNASEVSVDDSKKDQDTSAIETQTDKASEPNALSPTEEAALTPQKGEGTEESIDDKQTAPQAPQSQAVNDATEAETANGQKEEDIVVTTPQTIHSCTDAEAMRALDHNNPTLNYTYREVPNQRKGNIWKTIALTCLVCLLMGLSYFAGYFKVLCPCSYPILENWLTPILREGPGATEPKTTETCLQTHPTKKETPVTTQTDTIAQPMPSTVTAQAVERPAVKTEETTTSASPKENKEAVKTAEKPTEQKSATIKTPVKEENTRPRTHIVRKGDNLSKISRRYYGSDRHIRAIMKRNKLSDADNIALGTTIYLP